MYKGSETIIERQKRFSRIWSTSRANAGKTQEFMANGLGISKKTVQNWESGITSPDLFMGSEWFHVLGINPTLILSFRICLLQPQQIMTILSSRRL